MAPLNSYQEWEKAKEARIADPENPELAKAEVDAELAHFRAIGVPIRPSEPSWWERNKALIQGLGGTVVVLLIALSGYLAVHATERTGDQAQELQVLIKASPCSPTAEDPGVPRDPHACKRNIRLGLESLSAAQTCYLVKKSEPVLRIDGDPVRIDCTIALVPPEREKKQQEAQGERDDRRKTRGAAQDAGPTTAAPQPQPQQTSPAPTADTEPAPGGDTSGQAPQPTSQPSQSAPEAASGGTGGTGGTGGAGGTTTTVPATGSETQIPESTKPESPPATSEPAAVHLPEAVEKALEPVTKPLEPVIKPACEVAVFGHPLC